MHFDPAFLQALELAFITGAGGILWWALRRISASFIGRIDGQDVVLRDLQRSHADIRLSLTKISAVVGVDSDNGMRGTVKSIDDRLRALEARRRNKP